MSGSFACASSIGPSALRSQVVDGEKAGGFEQSRNVKGRGSLDWQTAGEDAEQEWTGGG